MTGSTIISHTGWQLKVVLNLQLHPDQHRNSTLAHEQYMDIIYRLALVLLLPILQYPHLSQSLILYL